MYNIEALKRKIAKEGLTATINFLSSDSFSPQIKKELEKYNIFINGFLCLSSIYSLV